VSERLKQLRGAGRLAISATRGLTDLVEAMHGGIARIPGTTAQPRTTGITGLVYRSVRGMTNVVGLVGTGIDTALQRLAPLLGEAGPASAQSEALLAALNGVFGDYLAATDNPLATAMQVSLPATHGPRPLLLMHGLCMNEQPLQRGLVDGLAALGYTPLLLRYNSGLHISDNGRQLAALLEQTLREWPVPVQDLSLVGHSMGGLLARSAVHHADGMEWPHHLRRLLTLGTPHFGAPLEQGGQALQLLLGLSAYSRPLIALTKTRSAGIQDLRWGALREQDWGRRGSLPLPAGVECYAIAAKADGLVPLNSALGRHREAARHLAFHDRAVIDGPGHLALQTEPAVLAQLKAWLSPR